MNHFQYEKPQTLAQAWDCFLRYLNAAFIAGGTDLMVRMKNRELAPDALISLRNLSELKGVAIDKETRIGPATTMSEIVSHSGLREHFPVLVDAAKNVGSVQVRNAGTIGGNICNSSPCADTALALLVLEAKLRLKKKGEVRDVAIGDFFLGPKKNRLEKGEILTDILIAKQPKSAKHAVFKKGRVKLDLAVASVAVLLDLRGETCTKARISAGSCAPTSLRLKKVEELLEGKKLSRELANEAANLSSESVSPITDIRSTAEYRREVVGVYVKRAIEQIMDWRA